MHIALLVDDYIPNSTRVAAKMMHELAIELLRQNHRVTVITPGTHNQRSKLNIDKIDDIPVWRFRNGQIKDTSLIKRALNETLELLIA